MEGVLGAWGPEEVEKEEVRVECEITVIRKDIDGTIDTGTCADA